MAKLKMKCIELLAPLEQSKEIIDCLQRMGTVRLRRERSSLQAVNGRHRFDLRAVPCGGGERAENA